MSDRPKQYEYDSFDGYVDALEDYSYNTERERDETRELARELRDALDVVVRGVEEWCKDVDADASWDGWDSSYKHFANGGLDAPRVALTKAKEVLNP